MKKFLLLCLMSAFLLVPTGCERVAQKTIGVEQTPNSDAVATGRTDPQAISVYGSTAYIQPGQTVSMVVQRGKVSSVFFVPCRAGTWTLKYKQAYLLGDAAYINAHWGNVTGCVCSASTPWNKWTTWTCWPWTTSKTITAGASNVAFKFDIWYPQASDIMGGNDSSGPAVVELTLN